MPYQRRRESIAEKTKKFSTSFPSEDRENKSVFVVFPYIYFFTKHWQHNQNIRGKKNGNMGEKNYLAQGILIKQLTILLDKFNQKQLINVFFFFCFFFFF